MLQVSSRDRVFGTHRVMQTAPLIRIEFSFQILTTNNQPANVAVTKYSLLAN